MAEEKLTQTVAKTPQVEFRSQLGRKAHFSLLTCHQCVHQHRALAHQLLAACVMNHRLRIAAAVGFALVAIALAGCVSPQRFSAPAPHFQTEPPRSGGPYTREREDREFGQRP
ncbi:MAG TPA: hypothetical protein VFO15_06300 [Xanthobacteraceae bacterium]|nr:hypothetical protein [Xanthobacteraceae bacterium]